MTKDAEKHNRKLAKTRERLLRQISRKGAVQIICPNCGAGLLTRPGQKESLCFACCQPVDVAGAERDALARVYRDGLSGYAQLLALGEEQLALGSFAAAEETYQAACAMDVNSGAAWRGLLAAVTENFHKEMQPPAALYEKTLSVQEEREASRLRRKWTAYTQHLRWLETNRRQRERTEQARRHNEQARSQAEAESGGKPGRGRAIVRALLITACMAGGLLLLFTGSGFMFMMGALMLSSLGRRRRR